MILTLFLLACRAHVDGCGVSAAGGPPSREPLGSGEARTTEIVSIPGAEVFVLNQEVPSGALCLVDEGRLLTGPEAFAEARARMPSPDAAALAALSMLLLEPGVAGMSPWVGPEGHGGRSPAVPQPQPPVVQGRELRYWRPHAGAASFVLVQVDLDALTLSATPDTIVAQAGKDPIERARAQLADPDVLARVAAVREAGVTGDPRVEGLLVEALANEAWLVRQEAARQLGRRGALGAEARAALDAGRTGDPRPEVRAACAAALAMTGG